VKAQTIQRWVRRGELRGYFAGRVLRVRLDELERYLARTPKEVPGPTDRDLDDIALAIIHRKKGLQRAAK
jgi:excisionase family DNA binding protein